MQNRKKGLMEKNRSGGGAREWWLMVIGNNLAELVQISSRMYAQAMTQACTFMSAMKQPRHYDGLRVV